MPASQFQKKRQEKNICADTLTANRIKAGCILAKNVCETDQDNLHTLVNLDFTTDTFDEVDTFTTVFGTDGTVTQDETGVCVDSRPFTFTIPVGNEHVKWLKYHKDVFPIPEDGELLYETTMAVKQDIDPDCIPCEYVPRIRNLREDIRIASAAMNMVDTATWMVYDIFLSDEMIYAFYERLPFGKPSFGGNLTEYAAFSHAIPIAKRTGDPENDFVKLGIGVRRKSVRYLVNGKEVFCVPRVGVRLNDDWIILEHGGTAEEVEVQSIIAGFGTFSLLDMAKPNNYARELTIQDGIAHPCLVVSTQSTGTADSCPNRNISHLAQIDVAANYMELYAGYDGRDVALTDVAGNPGTSTFAVSLADIQAQDGQPKSYKLFNQGAKLRLQTFKVSARCKLNDPDANAKCVPNTLIDLNGPNGQI